MLFILAFLLIAIASVVAYAVIILTSSAIVFSRVACALLAALMVSQGNIILVANSGFLNYVAWAVICLGIVYLLSTLPRVDMALRFLCTILMSVVIIEIVVMLLGSIIAAILGEEFQMTAIYEILVKIVCVLFSVGSLIVQGKKASYDSPTNPLMNKLERLLASFMYGVSVTFLCISIGGNWELPVLVLLLVLVGSTAAAFVADIHLAGKDIFGLEEKEEVSMPK